MPEQEVLKDMKNEQGREKLLLTAYFAAAAFIILLVCTRSSILYPYNNWDDANSYFSMGKSMFHGTLIYRDLFDQKGPYLYFLYGLCSLISNTTFIGVYIMEGILGTLDFWCLYRILRLYVKKNTALLLLPPLFAVIFSSFSFYWGGCAEEICLPAMVFTLYIVLKHEKTESSSVYSWRDIVLAGLCCGFTAAVKFTLLGYYFAFMVLVMLHCLMQGTKGIFRFLKSCGVFLAAMAIPVIPWLIYFGIRGGLDDWYRVYIYTNVFLYSTFGANEKGESAFDKIYNLSKILYWLIWDNFQYFVFIIAGLLFMLVRKGAAILERSALIILFGFTFLGIYIGGAHLPYYAFPLTAFAVSGFAAVGMAADRLTGRITAGRAGYVLSAISVLAALGIAYCLTPNRYYLSYEKEDVFLSKFTEDIQRDGLEAPTLLNYNCLDCGLYTTTGIDPTCYWFQTQTLPIDDVYDEQHNYMREGRTDYIVVRGDYPELIFDQYEQIDTFHQVMGESENDYHLFRLRSLKDEVN